MKSIATVWKKKMKRSEMVCDHISQHWSHDQLLVFCLGLSSRGRYRCRHSGRFILGLHQTLPSTLLHLRPLQAQGRQSLSRGVPGADPVPTRVKEQGRIRHGRRLRRARYHLHGNALSGPFQPELPWEGPGYAPTLGLHHRGRSAHQRGELRGDGASVSSEASATTAAAAAALCALAVGSEQQALLPLLHALVVQLLAGGMQLEGEVRRHLRLLLQLRV